MKKRKLEDQNKRNDDLTITSIFDYCSTIWDFSPHNMQSVLIGGEARG